MKITYKVDGKKKTIEKNDYFRPDKLSASIAVLYRETGFIEKRINPEPSWEHLEWKGKCKFQGKSFEIIKIEVSDEERRKNKIMLSKYERL